MTFLYRNLETMTNIDSSEFMRSDSGRSIYAQRVGFHATCEFMDYESAVAWAAILTAIATSSDPKIVSIDEVKAHVAQIIEEAREQA